MHRKLISMFLAAVILMSAAGPVYAREETYHLYFVKSGQTLMDDTGRIQGWADAPLSEAGTATAMKLAAGMKEIPFDYVYTSDRMRDIETAELIMAGSTAAAVPEPIALSGLREPNYGIFEGELKNLAWNRISQHLGAAGKAEIFNREKPVEQIIQALCELDDSNEAETYEIVKGRYDQALGQITAKAKTRNGAHILIVADELAINEIAGAYDRAAYRELAPGSLTQLYFGGNSYQLAASGDMKYVDGTAAAVSVTGERVEIYLIRHGKTIFNTMSRVQGWTDTPLTAEGRQVAEDLGRGLADLKFQSVYTSDLGRTVETAQLVLKQSNTSDALHINKVPALRETNYGKFDGGWNEDMNQVSYKKYNISTWEELSALPQSARKILTAVSEADETGQAESYETMSVRVSDAFIKIAENESANGGGNILIVSHGHAIMGILDRVCGVDTGSISNSSVCKIVYENGVFTAESVNDKSYAEKGRQ